MKNTCLLYIIMLFAGTAGAQKAWLDPGGTDFNPEDSVRLYINTAELDRKQLFDFKGEVFLWTWNPSDKAPLGSWNSSSDAMRMTRSKTNPNVYYFAMVPTTFYAVSASEVYDKGFSFLAKAKDGADAGKGEMKSEDLSIKPEKPGVPKVYTMPAVPKSLKKKSETAPDTLPVTQDDFITIFYNNKLETVAEMQSLKATDEVHVFIRITGSDGRRYLNAAQTELGNDLPSKMKFVGEGILAVTYNVGQLWRKSREPRNPIPPPAGVTPGLIEVQFAKVSPAAPNINVEPKADGTFQYYIGRCQ
jgi:hypothetical protein